jgi:hypothetical protein
MDNEIAYRTLFSRFAQPDDKFGEAWIEEFDDTIIENGDVVGTHSWESDNPGAGADSGIDNDQDDDIQRLTVN